MTVDANGNNHKAAGRPDGGRFDKKPGWDSDDDLTMVVSDYDARVADEIARLDEEDDPVGVAEYLDSLDPGFRFHLSDEARGLESRTLANPRWCEAHGGELVDAVGRGEVPAGVLMSGVWDHWRPDDPAASDRLAEACRHNGPDVADLCCHRAVSDTLLRGRGTRVTQAELAGNPYLTDRQRRCLFAEKPDRQRAFLRPAPDRDTLEAMLFDADVDYRAETVGRNLDAIRNDAELRRLVESDPNGRVRGFASYWRA